jgi:sugar transferase (PEP-CTERM system associated)
MPYLFKKYYPARNIFFFACESCLIFFALSSLYLWLIGVEQFFSAVDLYGLRALVVTFIFQITLYLFDLYDLSIKRPASDTIARIVQAFGIGCIILGLVYFAWPAIIISTRVFWISCLAVALVILAYRCLYDLILDRRLLVEPVVLLGTGKLATDILSEISSKRDSGSKIVGFIGRGWKDSSDARNIPICQDSEDMIDFCRKVKAEKIIVALDDRRGQTPIVELLRCKIEGLPIEEGIGFYERLAGKILVEKVNPAWLIYSEGFRQGRLDIVMKRLLDILLSLFGLLCSLPLSLVSGLIIKLESPGPVFYSQERVGEKGKVFMVHKFRSMGADAEKDGPVWAMENDCRVTRFGAFIRKVRIDELPQMWNVLKGEMSFVGPRPERPVFVEQLTKNIPYYSLRHSVKPGLTGWAQISYSYGSSEEDALRKLEYDLYYIKNLSVQMDLWIIFQTIKTVLFQKGSR